MATLVYLPGLVSDARVWRLVAERVGGDRHMADLGGGTSISGMAEGVLAEVAGPLIPVGHSMGGRVAMEMARQAPERMRGLVLVDTQHPPLGEGEREKREAKIALGNRDFEALIDEWLPPMVAPERRNDAALMEDLRAMVRAAGPAQHERQVRALIDRPDAAPGLREVRCPVLLLVGAEDAWSPPAQHEEIAALVGGAPVVVVPGAGHFLPVERPGQTASAILEWLEREGLRETG